MKRTLAILTIMISSAAAGAVADHFAPQPAYIPDACNQDSCTVKSEWLNQVDAYMDRLEEENAALASLLDQSQWYHGCVMLGHTT